MERVGNALPALEQRAEHRLDPARLGDHLDRLYRAAWALCGSREDAEDLVQETYARVLARPRVLRNEDDLGYLLRALRNTFLNRRRAESRRLRPGPLPDDLDLVRDPYAPEPHVATEPNCWELFEMAVYPTTRNTQNLCYFACIEKSGIRWHAAEDRM